MSKQFLQELVSFIQQKGFIWGPEPEIYGGLAGFYTYAPLGKLLKNNVEGTIRTIFQKNNFFEVECPTIMPKKVWEASGHLGGFTDPVVKCSKCNASFRADNLLEELFPDKVIKDVTEFFKNNEVKCPSCKERLPAEVKEHNLMMKTTVGLDIEAYNRPETATTTYLPFIRFYEHFRKKLPFGVFQIGNAYRNEISPRQHVLRTREFTQAEAQLFIFEEQKNDFPKYKAIKKKKMPFWSWPSQNKEMQVETLSVEDAMKKKYFKNEAYAYTVNLAYQVFRIMGIPDANIRLRQHGPDEKAFYADDAWDVEVNLNSFGWTELCGIHDRTNYDLKQHGKFSGKSMEVMNEANEKKVPHVLEIAFGVARPTFALLDLFYDKKEDGAGKTVLKLPLNMAPMKVAVFPLLKKPELLKLANGIYEDLSQEFICKYDESASIGKRYLRAAEEGIPFAVTVDFDSLDDKAVTLRDRNTEKQKRIKIQGLKETITSLIRGEIKFKDIKENL
jgi:glycyl-tRNA synthetase